MTLGARRLRRADRRAGRRAARGARRPRPAGRRDGRAARRRRARRRARRGASRAPTPRVLGGGTMGLMLARLLVLEGRDVTLADRHPERRAQAEALGARAAEARAATTSSSWRPSAAPRRGAPRSRRAAPGGTVVLVGGCPAGSDVTLPAAPLHYAELDVRGAFHHTPAEVDRALALLAERRRRLARAGRPADRPRRAAGRAGRTRRARASGSCTRPRP